MLKLAGTWPKDVVYDLGCGDGRIVIAAAKDFGARGVGVEIDPAPLRMAVYHARHAGVEDRVRFVRGDLFEADISEATVVTLFLFEELNRRLLPMYPALALLLGWWGDALVRGDAQRHDIRHHRKFA